MNKWREAWCTAGHCFFLLWWHTSILDCLIEVLTKVILKGRECCLCLCLCCRWQSAGYRKAGGYEWSGGYRCAGWCKCAGGYRRAFWQMQRWEKLMAKDQVQHCQDSKTWMQRLRAASHQKQKVHPLVAVCVFLPAVMLQVHLALTIKIITRWWYIKHVMIVECWMKWNANDFVCELKHMQKEFTFRFLLSGIILPFKGNTVSLVGTEPLTRILHTFKLPKSSTIEWFLLKQLSSKWAEHRQACLFTGSAKLMGCR